jgi:uncharacterized protein (TIGR00375 family)
MRQIADLHIHSRYSRACSRDLTLDKIAAACRVKGLDIIATGDFTFPDWAKAIYNELEEIDKTGLYRLKKDLVGSRGLKEAEEGVGYPKFILSTEVALIYKKFDKVRRLHICLLAPNREAAGELTQQLGKRFNLRSDGRPILGLGAEELCDIVFKIDPRFLVIPAHIWTPWFSMFGSKSGFDRIEDCFGEFTNRIFAYETGLSSDPEMNWRLSALDSLTLLSNSDAHSLPNLGREANVFEMKTVSYDSLYDIITSRVETLQCNVSTDVNYHPSVNRLEYTIEFYPEEGMYHYDGHRDCGVRMSPEESKVVNGICPVCKKPLIIGVMNRVDELADRPSFAKASEGKPAGKPGFRKLVELDKIIAEALGVASRSSKKAKIAYDNLVRQAGTEMAVLLDLSLDDLSTMASERIAEGIRRVRAGELSIEPGFDGQYGIVRIFDDDKKEKQQSLL